MCIRDSPITTSEPLRLDTSPGHTYESALAEAALEGTAANALTASRFASYSFGQLGINESVSVLQTAIESVRSGDTGIAESTMVAQAIALDSIFNELCRRAVLNMGEHLDATERYMRLALKAQNQCRTTLESLVSAKCPSIVYTDQANISHGPQQVNNNLSASGTDPETPGPQPSKLAKRTIEQKRNG